MKNLADYLADINKTATTEEAFDAIKNSARKEGFDRVAYSLVTDSPTLKLPAQHGLATSYPEPFINHYGANNYMEFDPVVKRVRSKVGAFYWSQTTGPGTAKDSIRLMNEAEESGICDGIGVGLRGGYGEKVGIGFARNGKVAKNMNDLGYLVHINYLASMFHEHYRSLLLGKVQTELSSVQVEILSWAAEGKSNFDIGGLMNMSTHNVDYHFRKIYKALGVNIRAQAIVKALNLGLIDENCIKITTRVRSSIKF